MTEVKADPLEKDIERKVALFARSHKWIFRKFRSFNKRGVTDKIFITPKGVVIFVEFKRRGKKPTALQAREHDLLRNQNCTVWVIDDIDKGKDLILDQVMEENEI